jgi:anthranilate/para-aminobenzoate synthase component II
MSPSQTHFARKLESIKDIYSEAEQRVRVTQTEQSTTQRVTHKGVTTTVVVPGPGATQASGSASPTKGKTSRGPAGECFCYVLMPSPLQLTWLSAIAHWGQ